MGVIRGAVCAENTKEDISDKAVELIAAVLEKNNLSPDDVDAVIFSATNDLDACYPATAVRERYSMSNAAFMCFAEMTVENSLDHCLRVSVFTEKLSQKDCKHCYLGGAAVLRKDCAAN